MFIVKVYIYVTVCMHEYRSIFIDTHFISSTLLNVGGKMKTAQTKLDCIT